ncbi:hypothetical protein PUMCH_000988 [Australozyma saopauloensis]|uniref:SMP-LTD domain-containing protein n=1 Tax=Australozyma saopauloensis TaxID=291208 RepID=A0AAX4H5I1_9ASCO|nr:hypothetical protein PUMCH_000988 [[Candida] saopauloensis]
MSLVYLLGAYFLGGITFLPILIVGFIYFHPKTSESPVTESYKAGEIEENNQSGLDSFKQGWLVVTHEYIESTDEISSRTEAISEASEGKTAYASLYKLVKNNPKTDSTESLESSMATGHTPSLSTEGTTLGSKKFVTNKRHRYFAVLKHGNLFLYKNEKMKDVKHVIVLQNHVVALWPRTLSEGSLFTKNSSIAILKSDWSRTRRLSDDLSDTEWADAKKLTIADVLNPESKLPAPPGSFFIYTDITIDKEDWYFTLLRATKAGTSFPRNLDPKIYAKSLHYDTANMMNLIQSLYSSEGQLQTKWLNAIIGRLFLSLQKTDFMKSYLVSRIEKKLNKLKTPGFLEKFQISKVDPGNSAPLITFPALKEINPNGELLVSFDLHYFGELSLQIATKANINLGSRFKTRDVDLALSITIEKIEGPMLVKIKPPPSARIWYTYEREPNMSIKIEPIISSRQMSYTIITSSIEKMMKESIRDSLVLPHWDDMIFYYTDDELYRGGVWDKDARIPEPENDTTDPEVKKEGTEQDTSAVSFPEETQLVTVTEEDDSVRLDSSSLIDMSPSKNSKISLSATLNDFTKRLRKPKSGHTLGIDETHCLSDGTVVENSRVTPASIDLMENGLKEPNTTLKKIGNWYSKLEKSEEVKISAQTTSSTYHPPEMISNRRGRKQSSASATSSEAERDINRGQFDFGSKFKESESLSRSLDITGHDLKLRRRVDSVTSPLPPTDLLGEPMDGLKVVKPIADELGIETQKLALDEQPHLVRSNTQVQRKPPPDYPL